MDLSTPIGGALRPKRTIGVTPKAKKPATPTTEQARNEPTLNLTGESVTLTFSPDKNVGEAKKTPEKPATDLTGQLGPTSYETTTTGYHSPSYSDPNLQLGANGTLTVMMDEPPANPQFSTVADSTLTTGTVGFIRSGTAKEHSHAALLASDAYTACGTAAKATSGSWMSTLGGAGGALLLAHGVTRAVTGQNLAERLEGIAEGNWGAQSMVPTALGEVGKNVATSIGVVGGSIQAGLGAKKMVDGVRSKDKEKIGIGAAETFAGACWILSAAGVATGITAPLFIATTVGAKLYQHRKAIGAQVKKGAQAAARKFPKTAETLKKGADKVVNALPWRKPTLDTPPGFQPRGAPAPG